MKAQEIKNLLLNSVDLETVDCGRFNELRDLDEGSTALVIELVDQYLANQPRALSGLAAGLRSRDGRAIHLLAHTLKSSSANVGAARAARICAEIEARAQAPLSVTQFDEQIGEELARLIEELGIETSAFAKAFKRLVRN